MPVTDTCNGYSTSKSKLITRTSRNGKILFLRYISLLFMTCIWLVLLLITFGSIVSSLWIILGFGLRIMLLWRGRLRLISITRLILLLIRLLAVRPCIGVRTLVWRERLTGSSKVGSSTRPLAKSLRCLSLSSSKPASPAANPTNGKPTSTTCCSDKARNVLSWGCCTIPKATSASSAIKAPK